MSYLVMKRSDVDKKRSDQIKHILLKYCKDILNAPTEINSKNKKVADNGIIITVALGQKYNIPLLLWISDIYDRMSINHWKQNQQKNEHTLTPTEFATKYLFIHQKSKKNGLFDIFYSIVPTLHKRIFRQTEHANDVRKYKDKLNDYIDIVTSIHRIIAQRNNNEIKHPSQLDVCIMPYDVSISSNDISHYSDTENSDDTDTDCIDTDDDDEYERKTKDNFFDIDIDRRLTNCAQKKIIHKLIKDDVNRGDDDNNWYKLLRRLIKIEKHKRYILIIDRRKKNNNKIKIYFYEAPTDTNQIPVDYHGYIRLINICYSSSNVLPQNPKKKETPNNCNVGLYHSISGYMFGISYHINCTDSIAVYCTNGGIGYRMFCSDMRNIWPNYFDPSNQIPKMKNLSQFELIDKKFDTFYASTNNDKVSNLYEDDQFIPLTQLNTIIQIVELLKQHNSSQWDEEVKLTMKHIAENYNDDECDSQSIIEDLDLSEGIENSDILFNLIESGIEENVAKEFGICLKEKLQIWQDALVVHGYMKTINLEIPQDIINLITEIYKTFH